MPVAEVLRMFGIRGILFLDTWVAIPCSVCILNRASDWTNCFVQPLRGLLALDLGAKFVNFPVSSPASREFDQRTVRRRLHPPESWTLRALSCGPRRIQYQCSNVAKPLLFETVGLDKSSD